jgi:hypothetical protein
MLLAITFLFLIHYAYTFSYCLFHCTIFLVLFLCAMQINYYGLTKIGAIQAFLVPFFDISTFESAFN